MVHNSLLVNSIQLYSANYGVRCLTEPRQTTSKHCEFLYVKVLCLAYHKQICFLIRSVTSFSCMHD